MLHPELSAVLGSERFLKEIELTANLQHPHILPLFDSGSADGLLYYVMPYVEGETLRRRLDRERQLPVGDAVRIAREVAEALDYALRLGVIHRDIKPENVLLHEGRALVADFGIALAVRNAGGARITETGLSLGTPQYMSPEQATAERELDARSDIYSLGSVLYEMLAGEPPHSGPTTQAIIAKIITDKPRPITDLRETVPAALAVAVHTALAKLPADRFSSAAEFAATLARPEVATGGTAIHRPRRPRASLLAALIGAAVPVLVAGWLLGRRAGPGAAALPPSRLAILAAGLGGSGSPSIQRHLALTPDGATVIFVAVGPDGRNRLMRQALDAAGATPIPGTRLNTASPVVSRDGRWLLGSTYGERLVYRYPVDGGPGEALPIQPGGLAHFDWDAEGALWFTGGSLGLMRLGAGDDSVTRPFGKRADGMLLQQILPDGRFALMAWKPIGSGDGPALVFDLRTGEQTPLLAMPVVELRYAAGLLVYVLPDGSLQAAPFDPRKRRITGPAVSIATDVSITGSGFAQLAVAPTGALAYIPEEPRSLVFADRAGSAHAAVGALHNFHAPQFSPDGRRLSVDLNSADGRDVWILSRDQGTLSRATYDRDGHDAVWTPDGRSITYTSTRAGPLGIYRKRPGGAESADSLLASPTLGYTGTWLRDGSALLTTGINLRPGSGRDIVIVRNGGRGPIEPFIASPFSESYPALSPDERWVAFVSEQSGREEVYVRPFSGDGDQLQVSQSGGSEPVWGPDGRELFYRSQGEGEPVLMMAAVRTDRQFAVTSRRALFPVGDMVASAPHANYDLSPDGRTFVMVRRSPATRIMVIQNLPGLVGRLRGTSERGR
jgi:serine/threonine-protein kinase